jgi:RES domain
VSSNTLTPHAVGSEAHRATRRLWRAVEAQHIASSLRLVANIEEQLVLEGVLEKSKPAVPSAAADLHYLLATPFRYASPIGSRFRAPGDSGVWYGAEKERTACAELGFWRWRFLMDSKELGSLGPSPQTVFRAAITGSMVDLTEAPFKRSRAQWTDPRDYGASQHFAQLAREANVDAIRYESVRDPEHAGAVAVLRPACFKPRTVLEQRIWLLTVRSDGAIWQREAQSYEFTAKNWER